MRENFHLWMRRGSTAVFVILPFVLAVFGPFGTYSDLSFLPRLFYWTVLVFSVGIIMMAFNTFALNVESDWVKSNIARIVIAAGCAALPSMAIVILLHNTMRPALPDMDTIAMLQLWLEIWVLGGVISLFEHLRVTLLQSESPTNESAQSPHTAHAFAAPVTDVAVDDTPATAAPTAVEPSTTLHTRLHRRLPAEHQNPLAPIISLSMQDHYVEITTLAGQHLILMRFSDAIAELDTLKGLRTHRSHWVSENHMVGLRRAGNRTMLQLSDGRELPVSQTYKAAVQDVLSRRILEREGISAP